MRTVLVWVLFSVVCAAEPNPLVSQITQIVDRDVKLSGIPGAEFGLVIDGKVLVKKSYGKGVNPQTVFQIGSVAKSLTAALVMRLQESAKLRLDDPIAKYLPGFCDAKLCQGITIRHLLSHTSGMPRGNTNLLVETRVPYSTVVQKTLSAKRACAPGSCYDYNNVSFALLQDIVEKAAGKPFLQVMEEQLWKPLNMTNTSGTFAGLKKSGNYYVPHLFQRGKFVEITHSTAYYPFTFAGALNSNLDDMLQFVLAELGCSPQVVSKKSLEEMHKPYIRAPDLIRWYGERFGKAFERSDYGLGHRVMRYKGIDVVFHPGWLNGSKSMIAMVRSRNLGFVFLQNTESPVHSKILFDILDLLAQKSRQATR